MVVIAIFLGPRKREDPPSNFSMSSDADVAAAEIAEMVASFNFLYCQGYCEVASSALFIYDAVITFDREVAYFWTTKRIGASRLLFFANKWISITVYVTLLSHHAYFSSDERLVHNLADSIARILQIIPGAAFSALRAYVLSRSKSLGILVAAMYLAPVGANLVLYGYQFAGFYFPPFGCLGKDNLPSSSNIKRAFKSAGDHMRLRMLMPVAAQLSGQQGCARQSTKLLLSDILLCGGTLYFVVLFILNLLHLVLSATSMAGNGYESYVAAFTAPFTAILTSHFLLGLQEANQMVVRLDPDDPLHSLRSPYDSTPSFISSLGGFVDPDLSAASRFDNDGLDLQVGSRAETREEEDLGAHGPQNAMASSSA
ncbi:hypothetical protein OH76DRAFT_1490189 [Lentinus brumalis]|uniref:DUF6533 domain-containing protein n=1 Tax=Lentinus brumalis TaxID=2498619 RepID=A0A371CJU7_9APHY|nr:hypothetical protein OH76DRAFT_1490189 [Polyporus brumalis]